MFNVKPIGNEGLTLKPVTIPVIEGVILVITLSFVKVDGRLYDKLDGGAKVCMLVLVTDAGGLP